MLVGTRKTDLYRIDNAINELDKRKSLAEQSAYIAKQKGAIRRESELKNKQIELVREINRLLMVRGELVKRFKEAEGILILMIMAKRRFRSAF